MEKRLNECYYHIFAIQNGFDGEALFRSAELTVNNRKIWNGQYNSKDPRRSGFELSQKSRLVTVVQFYKTFFNTIAVHKKFATWKELYRSSARLRLKEKRC